MIYLWQYFSVGTWLLAVSAFCIEVIIKVGVTIAVYALFLYDARAKEGSWEGLDDAVYYVKVRKITLSIHGSLLGPAKSSELVVNWLIDSRLTKEVRRE